MAKPWRNSFMTPSLTDRKKTDPIQRHISSLFPLGFFQISQAICRYFFYNSEWSEVAWEYVAKARTLGTFSLQTYRRSTNYKPKDRCLRAVLAIHLPWQCSFLFNQGYKKSWIPAKQKWLEFEVKDPLQNIKMTAEVKIESELLCCSGQVVLNFGEWECKIIFESTKGIIRSNR